MRQEHIHTAPTVHIAHCPAHSTARCPVGCPKGLRTRGDLGPGVAAGLAAFEVKRPVAELGLPWRAEHANLGRSGLRLATARRLESHRARQDRELILEVNDAVRDVAQRVASRAVGQSVRECAADCRRVDAAPGLAVEAVSAGRAVVLLRKQANA